MTFVEILYSLTRISFVGYFLFASSFLLFLIVASLRVIPGFPVFKASKMILFFMVSYSSLTMFVSSAFAYLLSGSPVPPLACRILPNALGFTYSSSNFVLYRYLLSKSRSIDPDYDPKDPFNDYISHLTNIFLMMMTLTMFNLWKGENRTFDDLYGGSSVCLITAPVPSSVILLILDTTLSLAYVTMFLTPIWEMIEFRKSAKADTKKTDSFLRVYKENLVACIVCVGSTSVNFIILIFFYKNTVTSASLGTLLFFPLHLFMNISAVIYTTRKGWSSSSAAAGSTAQSGRPRQKKSSKATSSTGVGVKSTASGGKTSKGSSTSTGGGESTTTGGADSTTTG